MKVFGRNQLRPGRTTGVSHIVSQSGGFSQRKGPNGGVYRMMTTGPDGSLQSFKGVAFIDGESHSFSLGAKQTLLHANHKQKHLRSFSRKRCRPNSKSKLNSKNPILDATLKERIKALKATKKISHRVSAPVENISPKRFQNMTMEDLQNKSAQIDQMGRYEHKMADPLLVRVATTNSNLLPKQRASSAMRGKQGQGSGQQHVVKNIGML